MTTNPYTFESLTGADLEFITEQTGTWIGAEGADPYKQMRALYVIAKRRNGEDRTAPIPFYRQTGALTIKEINDYVSLWWDLEDDEDELAGDNAEPDPDPTGAIVKGGQS